MLALNAKGFPSATASREAYLSAIDKMGFGAAHTALLEEAREWLLEHGHSRESTAGEGKLIHHAATYHAREAGLAVPDRGALCILLTNVFETGGIPIVTEENTEAEKVLRQFMQAANLTDETEARRLYLEAAELAAREHAGKATKQTSRK